VCCRVYLLKSVWYGVVKCVLQGLCVEKCVVRCGEVCVVRCKSGVAVFVAGCVGVMQCVLQKVW